MRRQPGFTLAAIVMLTLGLGLVAGGYTVFNGLFLRGWTVRDSDRVFKVDAARVSAPAVGYVADGISDGAVDFIRPSAGAADYVTLHIDYFRVASRPDPQGTHTPGMIVSANLFETLGIPMQLGTGFGSRESPVSRAVISNRVWRRLFGADPAIVGRAAWLSSQPVTIIGVTARGFEGLGEFPLDVVIDAGSPAAAALTRRRSENRTPDGTPCCVMFAGRLRDGRTRAEAQQELQLLIARYRRSPRRPAPARSR